jgi:uncharacterized RDD family membrane protein YckC/predicted RNA-binding Zn-ribbon protein involved in translation (DUF1610 family)
MSIELNCDACGKRIRARDSAAGKRAKCPGCGDPIVIPLPQTADEEVDSYGFDDGSYDGPEYDDGPDDDGLDSAGSSQESVGTRPCPSCAETIKSVAVKCRFCGEVFDPKLLGRQRKSTSTGRALATPGSRLAAVLIDGLIQLPVLLVLAVGITLIDGNLAVIGIALIGLSAILILVIGIYQLVIISTDGQSIGKRMMKIRILKYEDDSNPGFVHAVVLRAFVNGLIGGIPFVGPIYALADLLFIFGEEHRCLHDLIAKTKVVDTPEASRSLLPENLHDLIASKKVR